MFGLSTTCWQQSSNCNKKAVVDVTKNLIRSRNLTPTQFVCNHYIVLSSLPLFSPWLPISTHTFILSCLWHNSRKGFRILFIHLSYEEMETEVRIEMKSKLKLLYNMKRQEPYHYKEIRESLTRAEWKNVVIFARRRKTMWKVRDGNSRVLTMWINMFR